MTKDEINDGIYSRDMHNYSFDFAYTKFES